VTCDTVDWASFFVIIVSLALIALAALSFMALTAAKHLDSWQWREDHDERR